MPGDENCIETPLSQLVQWSCFLVLRNPCIGCFAWFFVLFFFKFNNTYYSLFTHKQTLNMAVHSLQHRGTLLWLPW